MKTKNLILVVLALIGLNSAGMAQQKYALLIGGNYMPGTEIPVEHRWNNGQVMDPVKGYDEFWNDTYLMWELLHDDTYGYSNDNIEVLFANGEDYTFDNQDGRYKSITNHPDIEFITDYAATKANVMSALIGFSTLTENDYLFIWIMSNGGNTIPTDNSNSYVYLWGYDPGNPNAGRLYDYELKEKLDAIPNVKKVVMIQAPNSGGFATKLAGPNTIVFTSSHQDEPAKRADNKNQNDQTLTENEVITGITYNHGEFGFHIYSPLKGASPTGNTSYGTTENFNSANDNDDDVVSLNEANSFWLIDHHSTVESPVYSDVGSYGHISSIQFSRLIFDDILATPPAPISGIIAITENEPFPNTIYINSGVNVIFDKAKVYFLGNTLLISQEFSTVSIKKGVTVYGNAGSSGFQSKGNLNIEDNVLFSGIEGSHWGGVSILNQNLTLLYVTFRDCNLSLLKAINNQVNLALTITDCDFIRSGLKASYYNQANIQNTYFTNSHCYLSGYSWDGITSNASIIECNFGNPNPYYSESYGIQLTSFLDYTISSNIVVGYTNGLYILKCAGSHHIGLISGNSIHDNSLAGIYINQSYAKIDNNVGIYENQNGIVTTNLSNVEIRGNFAATHVSQTQRIHDNDMYQIYSSNNSFPTFLKWNAIWKDQNEYCLIKWDVLLGQTMKDISNNFWGAPQYFKPKEDFCPTSDFNWLPIWELQYGPPPSMENDEILYNTAVNKSNNGDFNGAKADYQALVNQFPSSLFAEAALKEMLPLEEVVANDYSSLQNYYLQDSTIINNSNLQSIGSLLANWCDVKMENYPSAIDYFENIIDNPASIQDSVFAIIDLGYIYNLMEEGGNKSTYTGRYSQFKTKNLEEYDESMVFHTKLLFKNSEISETIKNNLNLLKTGELLQNVPNPFKGTTQIWFKLTEESIATLTIYDYTGKAVSVINPGSLKSGNHSVEFNSANLPSGIYFYSLEVNGIKTDTKKMTLVR